MPRFRFEIDVSVQAATEEEAIERANAVGDRLGSYGDLAWNGSYRTDEPPEPDEQEID